MGEELACFAIDVGVLRRDGLDFGHFSFEFRVVVLDKRERGQRAVRLDARRADLERPFQRLARFLAVIDVGRLAGEKDLRLNR